MRFLLALNAIFLLSFGFDVSAQTSDLDDSSQSEEAPRSKDPEERDYEAERKARLSTALIEFSTLNYSSEDAERDVLAMTPACFAEYKNHDGVSEFCSCFGFAWMLYIPTNFQAWYALNGPNTLLEDVGDAVTLKPIGVDGLERCYL